MLSERMCRGVVVDGEVMVVAVDFASVVVERESWERAWVVVVDVVRGVVVDMVGGLGVKVSVVCMGGKGGALGRCRRAI